MKALSKPLSSPGRAEKFPTPLMMRFLRTNAGSRSRGRSRSSPMFILRSKKNGNAAAINETQLEPSSPKVTCIGQVRVRRSSKNSSRSSKSKKKARSATSCGQAQCPSYPCSCSCPCTCCGVPRTRFCHGCTPRFHKPKSFCNPFWKCVSFFRFGYCKKVDTRDDSSRFGSIRRSQKNHVTAVSSASDIEESERNLNAQLVGEIKEGLLQSSSSPPKNALLLTRCRSAPYRSSSLASRFWGSPLRSETETLKNEAQGPADEGRMGRPVSPNSANEEAESRNVNSHEESEELDSSSNVKSRDFTVKDMGETRRESIHPLLLTRCKSEPARTGVRLIPEASFLTQRRSDTAESCLKLPQTNCD